MGKVSFVLLWVFVFCFEFAALAGLGAGSPIDFDAYLGPQEIAKRQRGDLCRVDAQYAPAIEASLAAFAKEWITVSNGHPTISSAKYRFELWWKGKEKFFAPYLAAMPEPARVYTRQALAHLAEEAMSPGEAGAAVLIGDSLMAGYGDWEKKTGSKGSWHAYNAGIGGDTIDLLGARAYWNILVHRPQKVILSISGNNAISGCLLDSHNQLGEGVIQSLVAFTDRLKSAGVKEVYFINLPPIAFRYMTESIHAYNQRMEQVLPGQRGVYVLDQHSRLVEADGVTKADWTYSQSTDPIHLSAQVYREVWRPVLGAILSR